MRLLIAIIATLLLGATSARADAVVNMCQSDRQAGTGINLAAALQTGGSITFNCPASSVIAMTATIPVSVAAGIDGAAKVTLDASALNQSIFSLSAPVAFTLANLTIKGPGDQGLDSAAVTGTGGGVNINGVKFQSWPNAVSVNGGAVSFYSDTFDNSRLGRVSGGGAITLSGVTGQDQGRVAPFMQLTGPKIQITGAAISNSLHSNITLTGVAPNPATLVITGSTFAGNSANSPAMQDNPTYQSGGALFIQCQAAPCTAAISGSTFTANTAPTGGAVVLSGGINVIAGSTFTGNSASGGYGGAVLAKSAQVTIENGTFTQNTATQDGGALALQTVAGVTVAFVGDGLSFSHNSAQGNGGALASQLQTSIDQTVFTGNSAKAGGGALYLAGPAPGANPSVLANAILTQNSAGPSAGVIQAGPLTLVNATIVGNTAIGVVSSSTASATTVSLINSIVAQNTPANCAGVLPNIGGNLQYGDQTCGSMPVGNPQLDSYFVPASGGPAAKGGFVQYCNAPPVDGVDLYGHVRAAAQCATGAVEAKTNRQIADLDKRFAGLLLAEAIALSAIVYLIIGGVFAFIAIQRKQTDPAAWARPRLAVMLAGGCLILLILVLILWFLARGLGPFLDDLIWPWFLLFFVGCMILLRRKRITAAPAT